VLDTGIPVKTQPASTKRKILLIEDNLGDARLLRAAALFEQAGPWAHRRPAVRAG